MSHLADATRESQATKKPWTVNVPIEFFAHNLTDRERVVFLLLDMFARNDTYCFPGYATIGKLANKSERSLQLIVGSLEEKGWIRTVYEQGKNTSRVGIILLRRVNPSTNPAADTPEAVAQAEAFLRNRQPGESGASSCAQKPATDIEHRLGRSQRLQLEKLSPHVRTLFNDLLGDDPDRALERMRGLVVDISRTLPDAPGSERPQLVDDLAALTLTVLMDHDGEDGNLGAHYEMAKWVQAREVGAANVSEALHNAVESVERGKGKSGSALYRSALEKVRRIDAPEHVVN